MSSECALPTYPIVLDSDFRDVYDHYFYPPQVLDLYPPEMLAERGIWYRWTRHARAARPRQADHDDLEALGLRTPPRGTVQELRSRYPDRALVVYTNPYAHAGEGKLLLHPGDAEYDALPGAHYATLYESRVNCSHGQSLRWLAAGEQVSWLWYGSTRGEWRSNAGEDVAIVDVSKGGEYTARWGVRAPTIDRHHPALASYPLVAIDFLYRGHFTQELYDYRAIDLNTAPGIKGTPLEERKSEIAAVIAAYIVNR